MFDSVVVSVGRHFSSVMGGCPCPCPCFSVPPSTHPTQPAVGWSSSCRIDKNYSLTAKCFWDWDSMTTQELLIFNNLPHSFNPVSLNCFYLAVYTELLNWKYFPIALSWNSFQWEHKVKSPVINSSLTMLCCNKERLINNPSGLNDDKRWGVDRLNVI